MTEAGDTSNGNGARAAAAIRGGGELTWREARQIYRLVRPAWTRWLPLTVLVIGTAWVAVLIAIKFSAGQASDAYLYLAILAAVWGYGLIMRWMLPTRKKRRQYRLKVGLFEQRELEIGEQWLETRTESTDSRRQWQAFDYFRQDEDVVILFARRSGRCVFVPRSFFSSEQQWRQATELIARKLPCR